MLVVVPKTRVVVALEGGIVQAVYCSDPDARVSVLELDAEKLQVRDSLDQKLLEDARRENDTLRAEIARDNLHEVY